MVKAVESVIKEKAVFFSISFRFSLEEREKERAILVLKVNKKVIPGIKDFRLKGSY